MRSLKVVTDMVVMKNGPSTLMVICSDVCRVLGLTVGSMVRMTIQKYPESDGRTVTTDAVIGKNGASRSIRMTSACKLIGADAGDTIRAVFEPIPAYMDDYSEEEEGME